MRHYKRQSISNEIINMGTNFAVGIGWLFGMSALYIGAIGTVACINVAIEWFDQPLEKRQKILKEGVEKPERELTFEEAAERRLRKRMEKAENYILYEKEKKG